MNSLNKYGVQIVGTGSALPKNSISNEDLSQFLDTSDTWISTRTGISNRRIVSGDESIVSLSVEASLNAIKNANIKPNDIDLIILATSTPEDLFGSASKIQAMIGAHNSFAFDLTAACSGFLLGFITASQFLRNGSCEYALVIGADILSEWLDWSDRTTCVLFGDGSAAVIIKKSEICNIIDFQVQTDGRQSQYLHVQSKKQPEKLQSQFMVSKSQYNYLFMNGKEVYKFAISKIPTLIKQCLDNNNIKESDVDWLVLHQANERILNTVGDKLKIDRGKILSNLKSYGNTSAASIPIVLDEAVKKNQIQADDLIVMAGFGAGLTWGVVIMRW
uniref:3-oxoacyl-acyl-carrier-protein synthase 3 n=1 Tax=Erythrolobus coxiae TaxID=362235 RepID=UPI001FCDCE1E|nr:3-oxoacyl-acyl-carrier-protein synthase 3 [Erythrolobus coxiae]UNJ17786.1 3-oxoacyl-acyl-carrier-protein synthase 3 [Erythrolobus coxiae]